MGPQLYSCGKPLPGASADGAASASMGPQLYSCGKLMFTHSSHWTTIASMGPQLYSCGKLAEELATAYEEQCFNGAATLQLRKARTKEQ